MLFYINIDLSGFFSYLGLNLLIFLERIYLFVIS